MSIHLEARPGEIAETVLMPGDPLRAKFIAENFLENSHCYNRVRNMLGYTGFFEGRRISVQGTGMGMGSTAIYAHELTQAYGAKRLIRVGTLGAIQPELVVGEVVLALSASGDASANQHYFGGPHFSATADFDLLLRALEAARTVGIPTRVGAIFSTDSFYQENANRWDVWAAHGILGVEMESQILYTLAKRWGIEALSILTVSDNIRTGSLASFEEKESSFTDMMKIALAIA